MILMMTYTIYSHRYLAAKVYYFGVRGGVRQFEEFITKTSSFNSRVVQVIDASMQGCYFM